MFEIHSGWGRHLDVSSCAPVLGYDDLAVEAEALAVAYVEAGADWAETFWDGELVARADAFEGHARAAG